MSVQFTIPTAFTAIDRFSGPVAKMGGAVQGFVSRSERLVGRANAAFSKLLTPITNLNRMLMGLGYYVGLFTLVRIIKNAIDIFADFQQANVDLAIVMGVSVKQNKVLADEARRIGLNYGVAATEVVKMQHALATLGFEQADILKMGRPLITGSSALEGANPEALANTVGALINSFESLGAGDTQHILDVMALSANRTALTFDKLATTLPIVSAPANAVNLSFEETVALLGVLSNAGVHVATSATSLKNIFIDSAKKGHTYTQVLENIAKHSDKLTYANAKFGKRSVVSALILSQKMHEAKNGVAALTEEFKNAQVGLTALIATERLNTFRGAQKLLNAAYHEFILAIEDGNGTLSQSLIRILKVASAVLLLSTDSDQAREAISKMDKGIIASAEKWRFWLKIIGYATAALIACKIILIAWTTAIGIANVAMKVWTALTYAMTAAQWLLNAALAANPIGLIIIAIALLLSWIALCIAKFDEWGAAALYLTGPLGQIALVITTIAKHWDQIVNAFSSEGILAGLKAIGMTIFDMILYPMQQVAKIMANMTGAQWAIDAEKGIDLYRKYLEMPTSVAPAINPKVTESEQAQGGGNAKSRDGRLDVFFNDPYGMMREVKSDSSWITPKVGTTNY